MNPHICRAFRRAALLLCGVALAACGGIPLTSMGRLMQLPGQLLDLSPAHIMVAIQVDARLVPPIGSAPRLLLKVTPKVPGAFEVVDKKLPLTLRSSVGAPKGLKAADAGRRWWVYSLPPETQAELQRVQAMVRQARAQPGYQPGGTLAMGVEQAELAAGHPALAETRWSTWMQVDPLEGFFEVWNGTVAQVLEQARQP
jgi:hypothetical protein